MTEHNYFKLVPRDEGTRIGTHEMHTIFDDIRGMGYGVQDGGCFRFREIYMDLDIPLSPEHRETLGKRFTVSDDNGHQLHFA